MSSASNASTPFRYSVPGLAAEAQERHRATTTRLRGAMRAALYTIRSTFADWGSAGGGARGVDADARERGVHGLQILPGELLLARVAQQVGWVQRRHQRDP